VAVGLTIGTTCRLEGLTVRVVAGGGAGAELPLAIGWGAMFGGGGGLTVGTEGCRATPREAPLRMLSDGRAALDVLDTGGCTPPADGFGGRTGLISSDSSDDGTLPLDNPLQLTTCGLPGEPSCREIGR